LELFIELNSAVLGKNPNHIIWDWLATKKATGRFIQRKYPENIGPSKKSISISIDEQKLSVLKEEHVELVDFLGEVILMRTFL
jgi:hypothetical protein